MGLRSRMFLLFLKLTVISTIFAHGMERFGIFEGLSINFTGLSLDVRDVSKGRCAARCFASTCRGIYFDGGHCKKLYETNDVPESERNHYNPVSLTSNENNLLINAGNPWAPPNGWVTLHPQLNLNLDDKTPYVLHDGALHIATENGNGFKTNGGSPYVDLGDWTGDACFVSLDSCGQGFTLLAYVNIVNAVGGNFHGYISSLKLTSGARNGAAIIGVYDKIAVDVFGNGNRYVIGGTGVEYPTGWIRLMAIYTVNIGVQLYIDNVRNTEEIPDTSDQPVSTESGGHIVLGRYVDGHGGVYGKLTVDWLTIWDRPLTEEERNLVHQS